jgi:hypothetical protein
VKLVEFQVWCASIGLDLATSLRRATSHLAFAGGGRASAADLEAAFDAFKENHGRRSPIEDEPEEVPRFASARAQIEALLASGDEVGAREALERAAAMEAVRRGRVPDEWSTSLERRWRDWRPIVTDEEGREVDLDEVPPAPPKPIRAYDPNERGRTSLGRFRKS